ncbi:protein phosphatase regulatory subunit [Infundibulicybe gibba]|nr:protein phosphatase regulatory subunit [Infundibulicybe gibba]
MTEIQKKAESPTTVESLSDPRTQKSLSARVVLPSASGDVESEDEPVDEAFIEDENDFLVDFPDETEDLELVHSRIGSLTNLRLPRFATHLKRLCLRQNFISNLDPSVFHLLVKNVGDALDKLLNLEVLDLSFNLLRAVPDRLGNLTSLHTIYFVQNRISSISNLDLELGGNKIRKIENLDALVNLEELWLGKNKITKLENLANLRKLKILSLQSNRITKLEGLDTLEGLEQLYLSHNGITRVEGLENNVNLTTLDIGNNFIKAIENISHLTSLEELWMNGNAIPDLKELDSQLQSIKSLETLYLEGNPCQTSDMSGYRRKVMLALPQLKQIDATYVLYYH